MNSGMNLHCFMVRQVRYPSVMDVAALRGWIEYELSHE